jgi:hypothetical protein
MAMISGGDESARNAFRAILRDDAPSAEGSSPLSISSTEEMSAGDVLEVKNLADAIERAERVLRESSRPRDMFADLGGDTPLPIPTDDASGPAVYAKPTFTPVPPAAATPLPPLPAAPLSTQPLPILMVTLPADEDAFLQPAGRMRHFAEETLDGYRPDSTMQVRAGARRKAATVVLGAILGVLALALGAGVVMARMPAALEAKPAASVPAARSAEQPKKAEAPMTDDAPDPGVPTLNVNDLPSAR